MPRPPRIQYPHAWYHVMNRVTCRKTLYFSEHHYEIFISLLEMASKKHNVAVHSYCLMKNHYHLLLCTPEGNISKFMQHFSSQFVTIINKHNHADGSLFKDRYKSILIDSTQYLLQVSRYIHRNPLEAGYVDSLDHYLWSSYKDYVYGRKSFIHTKKILGYFKNKDEYTDFLYLGIDNETKQFYKYSRAYIFGSKEFIKSLPKPD